MPMFSFKRSHCTNRTVVRLYLHRLFSRLTCGGRPGACVGGCGASYSHTLALYIGPIVGSYGYPRKLATNCGCASTWWEQLVWAYCAPTSQLTAQKLKTMGTSWVMSSLKRSRVVSYGCPSHRILSQYKTGHTLRLRFHTVRTPRTGAGCA